jgi:hypothetical protein
MVPTLPSSKSSVLRRSLYRRELQEGRAHRETAQKARGSPALLTDSKEIPVFPGNREIFLKNRDAIERRTGQSLREIRDLDDFCQEQTTEKKQGASAVPALARLRIIFRIRWRRQEPVCCRANMKRIDPHHGLNGGRQPASDGPQHRWNAAPTQAGFTLNCPALPTSGRLSGIALLAEPPEGTGLSDASYGRAGSPPVIQLNAL